ncbi:MAG: hypothetical protein HRT47_01555 [Candidatus Caenarcaniphilales bacterium]|nr:hypothetical protein [Candidatus Caenarcaniphilales bacterium]
MYYWQRVRQTQRLSPLEKRILSFFLEHENTSNDGIFIGVLKRIANKLELDASVFNNYLGSLQFNGLLKVTDEEFYRQITINPKVFAKYKEIRAKEFKKINLWFNNLTRL